MRRVVSTALVAIGVGLMAGPVLAATIIGTDDSETLMGGLAGSAASTGSMAVTGTTSCSAAVELTGYMVGRATTRST